jgi:hypothetical protein
MHQTAILAFSLAVVWSLFLRFGAWLGSHSLLSRSMAQATMAIFLAKAMLIIDTSDENFGCPPSDSRDGHEKLDAAVLLADLFELLDDLVQLIGKRIELGKLDIEFALPEFIQFASLKRFAIGVDRQTPGVPCLFTPIDRLCRVLIPPRKIACWFDSSCPGSMASRGSINSAEHCRRKRKTESQGQESILRDCSRFRFGMCGDPRYTSGL